MAKRAKVYSVDFAALERKAGNYRSMNMFEREVIGRLLALSNPSANNLSERQQDTLDSVYLAMETLTQRQQEVLKLAFGLTEEGPMTELQIAEQLGIAHQNVNRLKARALQSLRKELGAKS